MNEFDIHVFILCIIVFILLVAVTSIMLVIICKQGIALIRIGANDEKLKKEYDDSIANKKKDKILNILSIVFEAVFALAVVGIIIFNIVVNTSSNNVVGDVPLIKTVNSSSMATKCESNVYLEVNELDDQIPMDYLISIEKLPAAEEIKLYDIILYENEYDHTLILHRVIEIYPPMAGVSDEYLFMFQGDAVPNPDDSLVKYSDMKGIYRGKHVENLGSFVRFMHSPAGYICITFAVIVLVGTPLLEHFIARAKKKRLEEIGYIGVEKNEDEMS